MSGPCDISAEHSSFLLKPTAPFSMAKSHPLSSMPPVALINLYQCFSLPTHGRKSDFAITALLLLMPSAHHKCHVCQVPCLLLKSFLEVPQHSMLIQHSGVEGEFLYKCPDPSFPGHFLCGTFSDLPLVKHEILGAGHALVWSGWELHPKAGVFKACSNSSAPVSAVSGLAAEQTMRKMPFTATSLPVLSSLLPSCRVEQLCSATSFCHVCFATDLKATVSWPWAHSHF